MRNIIASPSALNEAISNGYRGLFVALPHAHESATRIISSHGVHPRALASTPCTGGKIGLWAAGQYDMLAERDTIQLFRNLNPICGRKHGRIVNITGATEPDMGIDRIAARDGYWERKNGILAFVTRDEWYFYTDDKSPLEMSALNVALDIASANKEFDHE